MTTTSDAPASTGPRSGPGPIGALDPIELEVTRSRLEAIAEQAALAVEHTAISPTITESKGYSVTLMDPTGALILGAGMVLFHFGAAAHPSSRPSPASGTPSPPATSSSAMTRTTVAAFTRRT